MKDKSLKILLGIIAVNLTLQTINQIDLFPTAYAQSDNCIRAIRNAESNLTGEIDSAKMQVIENIIAWSN